MQGSPWCGSPPAPASRMTAARTPACCASSRACPRSCGEPDWPCRCVSCPLVHELLPLSITGVFSGVPALPLSCVSMPTSGSRFQGPWQVGCWSWALWMTLHKVAHAGSHLLVLLGQRTNMPRTISAASLQRGLRQTQSTVCNSRCGFLTCHEVCWLCPARLLEQKPACPGSSSCMACSCWQDAGCLSQSIQLLQWSQKGLAYITPASAPEALACRVQDLCAIIYQSSSTLLHCPTGAGLLCAFHTQSSTSHLRAAAHCVCASLLPGTIRTLLEQARRAPLRQLGQ